MKYLVGLPQLYSKECTENGFHYFDRNLQGLRYNICHNLFKSYHVKPLKYKLKKRDYLFRLTIEIKYKLQLMDSDEVHTAHFYQNQSKDF